MIMDIALSNFQDQFRSALFSEQRDESPALACQPGFAVYRNTVLKGYIDALEANYPAVTRLVGEEWMRAVAAVYAKAYPPSDARMFFYGEDFPHFLTQFEPVADFPYLPAVAHLDRLWVESHTAPDAQPLNATALAHLQADDLNAVVFHSHPSARWAWFADHPAYTIWQRNRYPADEDSPIAWHGQGALLVRPTGAVESIEISKSGIAFLDACAAKRPAAEAANAALATEPNADLSDLLATLIGIGAFSHATLRN